jgi:NADH dehydrogenase (ubiquinone) flavoprotein 2
MKCSTSDAKQLLLLLCVSNIIRKGTPPKMGKWGSLPMNGQVSCEGPKGKTSLTEKPTGPGFMMRTDLKPTVDPASVKAHMHY